MNDLGFQFELPHASPIGLRCPNGSMLAREQPACQIIRGDLDYVASQTILRSCFELRWDDWEEKIRRVLDAARTENLPMASLFARARGIGEAELLTSLARVANDYPDVGALFHFFSVDGMARALDVYHGRPIINYISGERWALDRVLPMLRQHPVPIVVQPIDDAGIPATAAARVEVAKRVADFIEPIGIARSDIYVDGLTPPIGTLPFPLHVSVETIAAAKEAGFSTILWPANAGLGYPNGVMVAGAYAALAVQAGLDLAVVASSDQFIRDVIRNTNLIIERETKL